MKIIIQGDGGSWRGVALLEVLKAVEKGVGRSCWDFSDLISGCSTFAIAGSCLAAGMTAEECQKLYMDKTPQIFNGRSQWLPWNWARPIFDRAVPVKILHDAFANSKVKNSNPLMSDLLSKFMCTSVSLLDKRNHFFKSWEEKDGAEHVVDVVSRSFAAALYFGALDDTINKQVWADGGEGLDNCSLDYCIHEAERQGWIANGGVYILSLGCGHTNDVIDYSKKSSVMGKIDEIATYFSKLGANQSVTDQMEEAKAWSMRSKLIVDRLDFVMPSCCDSFTDYKYTPDVIRAAQQQCLPIVPQVVGHIKSALMVNL